jgi:putative transposase
MQRTNRHSVYDLQYHLVVVTKYRRKLLTDEVMERLKEIANQLFSLNFKCVLNEINGDLDHVHILFECPPQVQLSKIVNSFKTVSARLLRQEFPELQSLSKRDHKLWSESYYIGSVSERSFAAVKEYIRNQ